MSKHIELLMRELEHANETIGTQRGLIEAAARDFLTLESELTRLTTTLERTYRATLRRGASMERIRLALEGQRAWDACLTCGRDVWVDQLDEHLLIHESVPDEPVDVGWARPTSV